MPVTSLGDGSQLAEGYPSQHLGLSIASLSPFASLAHVSCQARELTYQASFWT